MARRSKQSRAPLASSVRNTVEEQPTITGKFPLRSLGISADGIRILRENQMQTIGDVARFVTRARPEPECKNASLNVRIQMGWDDISRILCNSKLGERNGLIALEKFRQHVEMLLVLQARQTPSRPVVGDDSEYSVEIADEVAA